MGKTWPLPSRSLESSWFIETTLRQRSCIIVRESQLGKKKRLTVEGGWSEKETSEGGGVCRRREIRFQDVWAVVINVSEAVNS